MSPSRKAAIYARVSSEQQVEKSGLDAQISECEKYANLNGYEVVGLYKDEGISGAHGIQYRLGLEQLLTDAKAGKFDFLLVHELDRLAREMFVGMQIVAIVAECDILLIETSTGTAFADQGALLGLVKLWGAGEDRKRILQRTKRGHIERAKKGLMSGPPPFGYDKDAEGRLVIDEEEAELVRRIYELYLNQGHHLEAIARLLNAEGVKTRRAKLNEAGKNRFRGANQWQISTLRCLFRNTIYKGTYVYGKTQGRVPAGKDYTPNPKRPLSKAYLETAVKNKKHLPHEVVEVSVPAIVDVGTWDRAQALLAQRASKMKARWEGKKYTYLLDGIVYCFHCGRLMGRQTMEQARKTKEPYIARYYKCRNKENNCPNAHKNHRMDVIDSDIVSALLPYLRNPDLIHEGLNASLVNKTQEQKELESKAHTIEQRLADIHVELKRLREAFLAGAITAEELKADRAERDAEADKRQQELQATKRRLEELSVGEDRAKAEQVIQTLKEIAATWQDFTNVAVEEILFGQGLWRTTFMAPEGAFKSVDLPDDHPNKELRDRLLEIVQNLVKRITVDEEGSIREYILQIEPRQTPVTREGGKPIPVPPPHMSAEEWDAHLKQYGLDETYIANRKCITSPSFTS